MSDQHRKGRHDRWAQFRFSIVGQLLSSPPEHGELSAAIKALAARTWTHPITGKPHTVAASTIERWYHAARRSIDPVGVLRQKVRTDAGQHRAMSDPLRPLLRDQYRAHPSWSYQLHADNLGALVRKDATLGAVPSYATVRRYMVSQGLFRRRKARDADRPGARRAEQYREHREMRSWEATHTNGVWHLDFHICSRKVVLPSGERRHPVVAGVIDDYSRLACHVQWYLVENAENLIHALSQAIQKRGLPRTLLTDNGGAMTADETTEGLRRLGVEADTTLPYCPEQNAKQEVFWAQVEGRLIAMLEGEREITLALLNEATQAWVEFEYNVKLHSEIGTTPIDRWVTGTSVGRNSPSSDVLRRAFRATTERTQRRSDGTFTLEGVRFEVPSRYRHIKKLTVRYASWDLTNVELHDPRNDVSLCTVWPLDKTANGDRRRRRISTPADAVQAPTPIERDVGIAPRLRELMQQYAATGLPPAYLPKDERRGTTAATDEHNEHEDDQ